MRTALQLLALAFLFLCQCKTVTGVVVAADGKPIKDAMVTMDCSRKSTKTANSGFFKLRAVVRGKSCTVRAWDPDSSQFSPVVIEHRYKAGPLKLTLKND